MKINFLTGMVELTEKEIVKVLKNEVIFEVNRFGEVTEWEVLSTQKHISQHKNSYTMEYMDYVTLIFKV